MENLIEKNIIKISFKGKDYVKTFKDDIEATSYYNNLSIREIKSEENLIDNLIKDGFETAEKIEEGNLSGRVFIEKNEIRILLKYKDGDKSEIEYNKVFKNRKEAETYFNKNIDINRFTDIIDDESLSEYIYDLINEGFDLLKAKKLFNSPDIRKGEIFTKNNDILITLKYDNYIVNYLRAFKDDIEATSYYNNFDIELSLNGLDSILDNGFVLIS